LRVKKIFIDSKVGFRLNLVHSNTIRLAQISYTMYALHFPLTSHQRERLLILSFPSRMVLYYKSQRNFISRKNRLIHKTSYKFSVVRFHDVCNEMNYHFLHQNRVCSYKHKSNAFWILIKTDVKNCVLFRLHTVLGHLVVKYFFAQQNPIALYFNGNFVCAMSH